MTSKGSVPLHPQQVEIWQQMALGCFLAPGQPLFHPTPGTSSSMAPPSAGHLPAPEPLYTRKASLRSVASNAKPGEKEAVICPVVETTGNLSNVVRVIMSRRHLPGRRV